VSFWSGVVICRFLDRIYRHISKSSHFAKPLPPPPTPAVFGNPNTHLLFWIGNLTFLKSNLDFSLTPKKCLRFFMMKNSMCKKFENHLDFFHVFFKETQLCKNMITTCIFSKVFSKKPNFAKYESSYILSKVFSKKFDCCKTWNSPSFF
jgi:hypothetical protein